MVSKYEIVPNWAYVIKQFLGIGIIRGIVFRVLVASPGQRLMETLCALIHISILGTLSCQNFTRTTAENVLAFIQML